MWIAAIILVIINRNQFTVDNIVNHSPQNVTGIIGMLLLLFAAKSLTVVFYSGVLYVVAGLLLPPYLSIPTSLVGTIIMETVPYLLGRSLGDGAADKLLSKYPKLQVVRNIRTNNDFIFSLLIRITGIVANDPFSAYMGAVKGKYLPYMLGSLLGELPMVLLLTLLGEGTKNLQNPFYVALLILKGIAIIYSVTFFAKKIKAENKPKDKSEYSK